VFTTSTSTWSYFFGPSAADHSPVDVCSPGREAQPPSAMGRGGENGARDESVGLEKKKGKRANKGDAREARFDFRSGATACVSDDDDPETRRQEMLREVRRAKRLILSDLSISKGEWRKSRLAELPDLLSTKGVQENLDRVHYKGLSVHDFAVVYESGRRPVVIEGLADKWKAKENWKEEQLLRRFAAERFKIGTDDDGYGVSVCVLQSQSVQSERRWIKSRAL